MKISYRTHPVLKFLEMDRHPINVYMEDAKNGIIGKDMLEKYDAFWKDKRQAFSKNVVIIKDTFMTAVTENTEKLRVLDWSEIGSVCGVLLWKKYTFCYNLQRIPVLTKGVHTLDLVYFGEDKIRIFQTKDITYVSTALRLEDEDQTSTNAEIVSDFYRMLMYILLFKKYAPVETKNLPAGQKIKGVLCNYKNETKINVQYLDSNWFTTLVKSDAFKVRGHFRLQPKKKDGEWTKELIWINEFQKDGYTAPARKLKEDPQG